MWDERYGDQEYAYGKGPNIFLKEWLKKFEPVSILMPADGKGRNGVFAAQLGWNVTSFDLSAEGKSRVQELAKEKHVTINCIVGDLEQLKFETASFDAIGLIYAHFAADKKSIFHQKLNDCLKPGCLIILEAFGKKHLHLNNIDSKVGGPKDFEMLYSKEEILSDFNNYEVLMLIEEEISLNEGKYHIGKGSVIRFIGRKK
jgi:SAM-dependent methyltransferase